LPGDRGIDYAAGAFTQRLAQLGFIQSMNCPGKITDNAFVESFVHSKAEAFHGNRFNQDAEVAGVLRSYLPLYHRDRLHSSLTTCRRRSMSNGWLKFPVPTKSREVPASPAALARRPLGAVSFVR